VLCLYVFGGEVLHGFSFALVVGILIGTYSSIAVAAPMLVAYQDWRHRRLRRPQVIKVVPHMVSEIDRACTRPPRFPRTSRC
jgi:hypothetical protein